MILSLTVLEKFHPMPSEAVFSTVFFCYNFRVELDNDVVSGVAVDNIGMDVRAKFGDCGANGFRDIRGDDFVSSVSSERTNEQYEPIPIARKLETPKRLLGVSP